MCQQSTCDEVADETLARYRRVGGVRSADESKVPVIERRRGQRAVDVGSGENVFAREGAIFEAWVTVTSTTKGYVPGVSATRHRWQSLGQGLRLPRAVKTQASQRKFLQDGDTDGDGNGLRGQASSSWAKACAGDDEGEGAPDFLGSRHADREARRTRKNAKQ